MPDKALHSTVKPSMSRTPSENAKLIPKDVNQDAAMRLIEAATQLFVEKGYRGVSIRAIATLANTNSALISYYFGDKEGLFTEVLKSELVSTCSDICRIKNS